jgi:hypothetical protein
MTDVMPEQAVDLDAVHDVRQLLVRPRGWTWSMSS